MIKPYTSTIDSLLDLARMVGDISFIAINVPIDHAISWWNGSPLPSQDPPYQDEPEAESAEHEPIYSSSEATAADVPPPPETTTNASIVLKMSEGSRASRSSLRTNSIDEGTVSDQDSVSENVNGSSTKDMETYMDSSAGSIGALGSVPSVLPAPSSAYPYPISSIHPARKAPGIARLNKAGEGIGHSRSTPKLHELYRWQLNQAVPAPSSHEIWHPPPSAYEGQQAANQLEVHSRLSNPLSQRSISMDDDRTPTRASPGSETFGVDEWRLYAPFPSAYPPTPLPAVPMNLAPPANVNDSRRHPDKLPSFAEEGQQGFGRSLQPPREPLNPGSDGSLSDDKLSTMGVQENSDDDDDDDDDDSESMDVDSEEDSEFEFDVTLGTPKRRRITNLPANRRPQVQQQVKKMASGSSMSSNGSTTLSTHANASTLRTSSSGSSLSISDDSSGVGHKRPFPETSATKVQSATTSKRSKLSAPTQFPRSRQVSSSTSETAGENEPLSVKPGDLPKKARGTVARGPITKVPSTNGQPPVPPKEEQPQARTGGGTIRGRGRGRGDVVPSRSSTRLAANSKADPQPSRPPVQQPTNPSQTNPKSNKPAPSSLRDTTVRNRR